MGSLVKLKSWAVALTFQWPCLKNISTAFIQPLLQSLHRALIRVSKPLHAWVSSKKILALYHKANMAFDFRYSTSQPLWKP